MPDRSTNDFWKQLAGRSFWWWASVVLTAAAVIGAMILLTVP